MILYSIGPLNGAGIQHIVEASQILQRMFTASQISITTFLRVSETMIADIEWANEYILQNFWRYLFPNCTTSQLCTLDLNALIWHQLLDVLSVLSVLSLLARLWKCEFSRYFYKDWIQLWVWAFWAYLPIIKDSRNVQSWALSYKLLKCTVCKHLMRIYVKMLETLQTCKRVGIRDRDYILVMLTDLYRNRTMTWPYNPVSIAILQEILQLAIWTAKIGHLNSLLALMTMIRLQVHLAQQLHPILLVFAPTAKTTIFKGLETWGHKAHVKFKSVATCVTCDSSYAGNLKSLVLCWQAEKHAECWNR